MAEELFSPLQEYRCKGKMVYNSKEFNTVFSVKQMQNGRLVGEMEISSITYGKLHRLFESHNWFRLSGIDDTWLSISVNNCYLTSITYDASTRASAKFNAFEAFRNYERLGDKPKRPLVVMFALLNVDETFRVKVDTRLGKLYLRPIKGYKERLPVIKTLGVSGITAVAEIFIKNPNSSLTFKEILSDSIDVVEGFVQISRLADTCYNDWCSAGIYEKMSDSERYELVLYKMRKPKAKPPKHMGLTNPAHSSTFYETAYAGYKGREKELKDLYDFDIALEWYLEANIASVLESQYLMACTCLELLVDRYQTTSETELIMDKTMFDEGLYSVLVTTSRELMKKMGISSSQRRELYMKLKGLNRRSLRAGIESLVDHLKIKYDDLFDDLGVVIGIRNEITHTGTYANINELSKAFTKLYVLLTRMFLSILNYDQNYFDWGKGDWVHFRDVCEK